MPKGPLPGVAPWPEFTSWSSLTSVLPGQRLFPAAWVDGQMTAVLHASGHERGTDTGIRGGCPLTAPSQSLEVWVILPVVLVFPRTRRPAVAPRSRCPG